MTTDDHANPSEAPPVPEVPRGPGAIVIMIFVIEALLLAGAVAAFITNRIPLAVFLPTVIVLAVCSAAVVFWVLMRNEVRRIAELLRSLDNAGLDVTVKMDGSRKKAIFEQAGSPKSTPFKNPHLIRWAGVIAHDGRTFTACEVHTQKGDPDDAMSSHNHVSVHTACPRSWPPITLRPASAGALKGLFGKTELLVESEAFNARWKVAFAKPDRADPTAEFDPEPFALMVLTPEIQEFLLSSAIEEHWHIGAGSITCVRALTDKTTAEDVTGAIDRVRALIDALDPALAQLVGDRRDGHGRA